MTQVEFTEQLKRLKTRFGEKAFDPEFSRLVLLECASLSQPVFARIVSTFIGARPHNRPPLLVDFREERARMDKLSMDRDTRAALNSPEPGTGKTLAEILNDMGATSIKDAMAKALKRP